MKKKRNKKAFERFKKSFMYWRKRLGLQRYNVYFLDKAMDDVYAQIKVQESGCSSDVYYDSTSWPSDDPNAEPGRCALHEVLHLLTHRLLQLGAYRFSREDELLKEWESVVVALEGALSGDE